MKSLALELSILALILGGIYVIVTPPTLPSFPPTLHGTPRPAATPKTPRPAATPRTPMPAATP